MKVEWGSLVTLEYEMLLDSGEELDSSAVNGPLQIRVGEWRALPGLGQKLIGLQPGEERLLRLAGSEAFGDWDPAEVLTLHDPGLADAATLEDGMSLRIETGRGESAVCRVYRVSDECVALDFNHPLAGQPLTFFIRVLKISPPAPQGEGASS